MPIADTIVQYDTVNNETIIRDTVVVDQPNDKTESTDKAKPKADRPDANSSNNGPGQINGNCPYIADPASLEDFFNKVAHGCSDQSCRLLYAQKHKSRYFSTFKEVNSNVINVLSTSFKYEDYINRLAIQGYSQIRITKTEPENPPYEKIFITEIK